MLKYLRRFYYRYSYSVNVIGVGALFLIIFHKPLYFVYYTSQSKEFLEDPKRLQAFKEQEERKEKILKLTEQIKNCEDKEEKKKLEESLKQIHLERYKKLSQHPRAAQ